MSDTVRLLFSHEELRNHALRFMTQEFGYANEIKSQEEKDRWHERLGLLVHFVGYLQCPTVQPNEGRT